MYNFSSLELNQAFITMSDSVLCEKNCLVSIFYEEDSQTHTVIKEILKKGENKTIQHMERQWSTWCTISPETKELPRRREYLTNTGKFKVHQGGSRVPSGILYHQTLSQEDRCSMQPIRVRNRERYAFKGFSGRRGLLWNLLSIAAISLPSSLPGKLDKYACNIQFITLLSLIPFALPTPHWSIALKI